ncbi:hypothetical protein BGZ98_005040 [Dissophora globulifera]|nr:hypothetical protein BGZ98_005040 [Dissophora globulifera]
MGFEIAALVAHELNRTLILPPIVSNTHNHENTHQRWSQYFDIPRFTNLTGVKVVEWDLIRPLTPQQRQVGRDQAWLGFLDGMSAEVPAWTKVAENITCDIIYGYGSDYEELNESSMNFAWHFLFRPIPRRPRPRLPGMKVFNNVKIGGNKIYENDIVAVDDLIQRYRDDDTHMLWLTHVFKLKLPGHHHLNRYWYGYGQNIHFIPQLMDYATMRVNQELEKDYGVEEVVNDDPETQVDSLLGLTDDVTGPPIANNNTEATQSGEMINPAMAGLTAPVHRIPHIAVHIRRGDIFIKCSSRDMDSCIIPFELYVDAVARARTIAAQRGLVSRLPVVVTTDSRDEDDFRQIKALGWHRIDHDKYETVKLWGTFGPAMVDAAILAHADEFVGSGRSTMSRIAASRQKAWYHRAVVYPIVEKSQRRKRELMPESGSKERREEEDQLEVVEDVRIVF